MHSRANWNAQREKEVLKISFSPFFSIDFYCWQVLAGAFVDISIISENYHHRQKNNDLC